MKRCPECGIELTNEMISANMCWEGGKILDESLLDGEVLNEIQQQREEHNPFLNPAIKNHKLTTGFDFEGYTIKEYIGLVSGEAVIGTGLIKDIKDSFSDLFGVESNSYATTIKDIKKKVLYEMIKESIANGGNGIIGISYSFMALDGNMIAVSVNGTSVNLVSVNKQ